MYNAIKFFGSVKELLGFTRSLRVAELLEQEYNKNVHSNPCECGKPRDGHWHSAYPDFSEEHGCE